MSKPKRRANSANFYAQRAVPKDLRGVLGAAPLWKSLGTSKIDEAKPLERAQQDRWDALFAAERDKLKALPPVPLLDAAASRDRGVDVNDPLGLGDGLPLEPDYDDLTPVEQQIEDAVEAARERWERAQNEERELLRLERRADATHKAKALGEGTPKGTPLGVVVDRWAKGQTNQKTIDRMRRVVEWFERDMGRIPVEKLTPDNILDWREKLLLRVKPTNARTKLANLNTLLRYGWMKARLIQSNPALGVTVDVKSDPEEDVQPFDLPALKAIFSSPIYTRDERPDAGAGEAAYWLPLLALYTGARLNELGQLRPSDILQVPYVDKQGEEREPWCIRIVADKADGLKLKNRWSARRIPVHPELVRLGFLSYVKAAQTDGLARLFPELRPDKYTHVTANWSKWFGRYLRTTIQVTNDRMRFHSFRHTFKDCAREVEAIPEDVSDAITGHKGQSVARRYGNSLSYPLRPMVAAMAEYRVTGLTLPSPPPAFRLDLELVGDTTE